MLVGMVVVVMVTLHINKNVSMPWLIYCYWEIKLSLDFVTIYSFASLVCGPHTGFPFLFLIPECCTQIHLD